MRTLRGASLLMVLGDPAGKVETDGRLERVHSVTASSTRRVRSSVAVMAAVLGAVLVSPIPTPPAQAAQPQPGCQAGFLQASPPSTGEPCVAPGGGTQVAAAVPVGFQESVVWSGLTNPTAIRFAADGRVFVAEKSGNIKVFDNLADTTPTVFSDLPGIVAPPCTPGSRSARRRSEAGGRPSGPGSRTPFPSAAPAPGAVFFISFHVRGGGHVGNLAAEPAGQGRP